MNPNCTLPIVILALAALGPGNLLLARPAPQTQDAHLSSDITAIGHRNLGAGVNLFSLDKENQIGKQLALEVARSSRMVDDPVVTAYLDRIAQNLAKNSDARFPITIRVIDSDVMNAFTLPGGFQYVNSGLILQTEGEAELAGVLARGIAHTALRSSTMEETKGELMRLASIPAATLLGPPSWTTYGSYQALNLAIPLTFLNFRRDAERAADFYGLQYLYKSGYDPECFIRFLERKLGRPLDFRNLAGSSLVLCLRFALHELAALFIAERFRLREIPEVLNTRTRRAARRVGFPTPPPIGNFSCARF